MAGLNQYFYLTLYGFINQNIRKSNKSDNADINDWISTFCSKNINAVNKTPLLSEGCGSTIYLLKSPLSFIPKCQLSSADPEWPELDSPHRPDFGQIASSAALARTDLLYSCILDHSSTLAASEQLAHNVLPPDKQLSQLQ